MARRIRYWYTYRTAVAILLAVVIVLSMFGLYNQQIACDTHGDGCRVNVVVHPEDRLFGEAAPNPDIEIVGIDDASVNEVGQFPLPRNIYAKVLRNLEAAGAAVVAFDVSFTDPRDVATDADFAAALQSSSVPVLLSYPSEAGAGRLDQAPLREFWCTELTGVCRHPYPNVQLASTDIVPDSDGVVRRVPMSVKPLCFPLSCSTPSIHALGFEAYRVQQLGADFASGPDLTVSRGEASFGTAWLQPLPVDSHGSALVNFTTGPGGFAKFNQYLSFGDVAAKPFNPDLVKGKIVLIGAYHLTGVHDEVLTPDSNGTPMPGVELHANIVNMFLPPPAQPRFLTPESPLLLFLIMLLLALATAIGVARVTVLWGLAGTVGALALFTIVMSALSVFNGWVPDLFHPWLAITLTYTGVTAYRFLYEDREKRKVTALFGHYLKPEIVADLAKTRGGVDDILRGGERRDITLMFVDIRGFTAMSESMAADDVTEVVQMYLDHLSGIIFTWDGTVDKYVGDEIMAFWNAPRLQPNHALLAVRCAYDLVNRAPELQQRLVEKGLPPIRWGIGINSGPAVVGNMGSRSRLQYTALGDTVNTAARFCAHAPAFQVLIGQETYDMCRDYIAVDLVPGVQLKGKSAQTFRIYEVTAVRETPAAPWVPFPTQLATQSHTAYTARYTQQTIIAASETGPTELLVGDAAEQALANQAREQRPN